MVDHPPTRVNHIRHVTGSFILFGLQERLSSLTDHLGWIVPAQEGGANAVLTHGADTVGEQEPPGLGLQGRAAIANLYELPRVLGLLDAFGFIPALQLIGLHQE